MKVAIDQYIAPGCYIPSPCSTPARCSWYSVLRYGQTYSPNATGQRAMYYLRMELFAHLQRHAAALLLTATPLAR